MVSQIASTTLESKPLDWFRPYTKNARTHNPEQISRLKEAITQYGARDPIEACPDGELIAGHGRLAAARELGLAEFPTLIHHDLTPIQVQGYRIANNRIAELSGWDRVMLASDIRDLEEHLLDDEKLPELGFDQAGIESLMRELDGPPPPANGGTGEQRGMGTPVISYTLVFDNSDQQDRFFEFVRHLKKVYPGGDLTVAAMLHEYITQSMREDNAGA